MDQEEKQALSSRLTIISQNSNMGMTIENVLSKLHLLPDKPNYPKTETIQQYQNKIWL